MSFKLSTPGKYIDALNKEPRVNWPIVKNQDFLPYTKSHMIFWSGYYSSRPGFKKQIKVYSSLYHAQSKLFAEKIIKKGIS